VDHLPFCPFCGEAQCAAIGTMPGPATLFMCPGCDKFFSVILIHVQIGGMKEGGKHAADRN